MLDYGPAGPLKYHMPEVTHSARVAVYAAATGGAPLTEEQLEWDNRPTQQGGQDNWDERPTSLWLQGTAASIEPGDQSVTLTYVGWAEANVDAHADAISLTVVAVDLDLEGVAEQDAVRVLALQRDAEGALVLTVKDSNSPAAAVLVFRDGEWALLHDYPNGLPEAAASQPAAEDPGGAD